MKKEPSDLRFLLRVFSVAALSILAGFETHSIFVFALGLFVGLRGEALRLDMELSQFGKQEYDDLS